MERIVLVITCMVFILSMLDAQSKAYWAETTNFIDSFELIENGSSRMIPSNRTTKDQYLFNSQSPEHTFIRMHCVTCEDGLTLKVYSKAHDSYTSWIKLTDGQRISLAECFARYPEKTGLSRLYDNATAIFHDFWDSLRNGTGRTARHLGAILRSGSTEPGDPKLEFLKTDYYHFLNKNDFSIHFRNLDNYPIKSIYIISHYGDLMFHAGSREILGELFDLSEKVSPTIRSVLKVQQNKKKETTFVLNWKAIQPYLFQDLSTGATYQLGIEIEGDDSGHNPYLFNFEFFSAKQLEEMQQFFTRD